MLDLLPGLHSRIVARQTSISGVLASLDSLPDVAPHLASLAGLRGVYAQLPQPPSALAERAQRELEGLLAGVDQVGGLAGAASRGLGTGGAAYQGSPAMEACSRLPGHRTCRVCLTGHPPQALASANTTVSEAAEEARGMLADARAQTVGRLEGYEERWLPTVRRFDKM